MFSLLVPICDQCNHSTWAINLLVHSHTLRGTLSSYAWVLLCIGFLQQRRPPVLPVLQQLPTLRPPVVINGWDASFCNDADRLAGFGQGKLVHRRTWP
jgi:hypothetical protein